MVGVGRLADELSTGFCGDGVRFCSVIAGPVVTVFVVVVVAVVSAMVSKEIE